MRSVAIPTAALAILTMGAIFAASCGGRASAAKSDPASPPLAPVEAAAAPPGSTLISASTGGTVAIADASSPIAGASIDLPPGALSADATVGLHADSISALRMFPDLAIVRATASAPLVKSARIRIPYTYDFLAHWNITDERQLQLYALDDDGLWGAIASAIDPATNSFTANVATLSSWVVAPGWMLTAWQQRALIGDDFTPGARNLLLVHGWNSSPWDGCELQLAAAIRGSYDHVLAYAYPSVLDIGDNATWLRSQIAQRYPNATFDIIGFSEGGLVGRAAIEPGAWNSGQTIAASVRNLITIATPHTGILPGLGVSLLDDVGGSEMRPGSAFLRALNDHPVTGNVKYNFIAGDAWHAAGVTSDGLVSVDSALGKNAVTTQRTATIPLVHATPSGEGGMPCDPRVYATIKSWIQ